MLKNFPIIAIAVIVVGAVVGGVFGHRSDAAAEVGGVTNEMIVKQLREADKVVMDNYAGKPALEDLTEGSIQGMLWTLDPHSSFFNRRELKKLDEEQSSQFYGIGVSIFQHRDGVYVQSVVPGTPAEKAGLRYGDKFMTVEGKDATEWSASEVSKNVRGERGKPVKLTVARAGVKDPVPFEIVRGGVPLPSIRNYFMLPNGTGYVALTGGFQQTTSDELTEAINDLKKQGMKSLILDLRNNPGGLLEQAVDVASKFIPGGQTVVSVKTGRFGQNRDLPAIGGEVETMPLVVMINGGSASASEIVAGAIQDYDRGVLVGSDSFGKGLVQRIFRLPYGTGLTLTTARYYTPFGRSLQRDYSSGSIYDYYTHMEDAEDNNGNAIPKPEGVPVKTTNGRILYGGRGIEPDVRVDPIKDPQKKAKVNEEAFFFVRQLVAGKIPGFETYKNDKQSFVNVVRPGDFAVSDKLFEAFIKFALADKESQLNEASVDEIAAYARSRIREELATANYSSEAGFQVLMENDPQVAKALEAMPEASKLVASAGLFGQR